MLVTKSIRKKIKHIFLPKVGYRDKDLLARLRKVLTIYLGSMAALTISMVLLEGLDWWKSIWFSFTTVTTVGYGDWSPESFWGQATTVIFGFLMGISLLMGVIEAFMSTINYFRKLKITGRWRYTLMKDHIILGNNISGTDDVEFYTNLIDQFRSSDRTSEKPIAIVTEAFPEGLPTELQMENVALFHGYMHDTEVLKRCNIESASDVILFVRNEDLAEGSSESYNFNIIHKIRRINPSVYIVAEAINETFMDNLKEIGANACMRPLRAYPEMVARAVISQGSEKVLENLFSSHGDELVLYNIESSNISWLNILTSVAKARLGTAVAFVTVDGKTVVNPDYDCIPNMKGLFLMVKDDRYVSHNEIYRAIAIDSITKEIEAEEAKEATPA